MPLPLFARLNDTNSRLYSARSPTRSTFTSCVVLCGLAPCQANHRYKLLASRSVKSGQSLGPPRGISKLSQQALHLFQRSFKYLSSLPPYQALGAVGLRQPDADAGRSLHYALWSQDLSDDVSGPLHGDHCRALLPQIPRSFFGLKGIP